MLVGILVLRRAWLSDDAYITFRTVDNLVHGYSLTWNTGERVQAFTHPLWLLLLSLFTFFTREVYYTSIILSLACTLIALILFGWKSARTITGALLGILALGLSNAFVDYSTSGLENPLSHLLTVLFFVLYFRGQPSRRNLFVLSLVASLAAVNRLDTFLVFIPPLLITLWQVRGWKSFLFAAAGQAPLFLWEAFSLFYYGFLFPNTAYAKLNTGIPQVEILQQGFYFLLNAVEFDPLTPLIILAGLGLAVALRNQRSLAAGAGMLLHLGYIVKVGGDFMSGRFLTILLVCAVVLLGQVDFRRLPRLTAALTAGVIILAAFLAPHPTWWVSSGAGVLDVNAVIDDRGVADERSFYYLDSGLMRAFEGYQVPAHRFRYEGERFRANGQPAVLEMENVGFFGYYAGPQVHVVDVYALADPLLARLPAQRYIYWRVGHYMRAVPEGYLETIVSGTDQFADSNLGLYYQKLSLITSGPLFSRQRLLEIWKMNTGQYDDLIDRFAYRYPGMQQFTLAGVSGDVLRIPLTHSGAWVHLDGISHAAYISVEVDPENAYQVVFVNGNEELGRVDLPADFASNTLSLRRAVTPRRAEHNGFDSILILPMASSRGFSDNDFGLGRVTIPGSGQP